jgi:uncharacterized protein
VLGPTTARGPRACSRSPSAGTFEHGRRCCSCCTTRTTRSAGPRARALLEAARPSPAAGPRRQGRGRLERAAIAALAEAGALLDEASSGCAAAVACADLLVDLHLVDGRLRRVSRDGEVGRHAGVLEDHGCVAEGLLALHQVTGEARWLERAGDLLDVALERFRDADGGLLTTPPTTPSWALAAAEAWLDGPREVAVVGVPAVRAELERVARLGTAPGAVVVAGEAGSTHPLLAGRSASAAGAAAYVCRGFVCDAPTSDPAALAALVGAGPPAANSD